MKVPTYSVEQDVYNIQMNKSKRKIETKWINSFVYGTYSSGMMNELADSFWEDGYMNELTFISSA